MALSSGDILVYDGTKWVTSEDGSAPTLATGSNIGTGSPSVSLIRGNNTRGEISFTTGTGPVAGQMVKVTFNPSTFYSAAPYVFIMALDFKDLDFSVGDRLSTGFNVYCQNAPAAGTPYRIYYWVVA